ncbi:MAG: DNA primase [Planctomycetes bacterium]|nr:DNA primase [Planctomycetota bacterium]
MHDFETVKEEIRQRVDLVELVSEHVALTRSGRSFRGLCPFHREKTPSFHVIPDKLIFHCFGCKAGGDAFKFVQLREGLSFGEAVRFLADRAGIEMSARRPTGATGAGRLDLAKVNAWAAGVFRGNLTDAERGRATRDYLAGRGISPESAERFGIGLAAGDDGALQGAARLAGIDASLLLAAGLVRTNERGDNYDTFRQRLMFPIRDATQRVVGFGGRTLADHKAKYINTAQNDLFDKSKALYGLDLARRRIADTGQAIIVEGYTDCIACHQAGFDNAVATLGTALTDAHVDQLRRYGDRIVLVFDSDSAGMSAAERALGAALQHGLSVSLAFVPQGKDPSDFLRTGGAEGFASLLNSATDALRFTWEQTLERYASGTADAGRRRAIGEFVEFIAGLTKFGALDAIQQGLICQQIAKLLGLGAEQIHALLGETVRRRRRGGPTKEREATDSPPAERSAEQAALTTALEVLLNEPGLYDAVAEVFDPQRFRDPVLRRIGAVVKEMAVQLGEFSLVELLARFSDPVDARQATELHIRGATRGNFEATLNGAAACLHQMEVTRQAAALARQMQSPGEGDGDSGERPVSAPLEALQAASRRFHHFAPRSMLSAGRRSGD